MIEVDRFFKETNHSFLPILNQKNNLLECFLKKPIIEESISRKWFHKNNAHLAKLIQQKNYKNIRICMINSTSQKIYEYFKYYKSYFDSVDKIFWYDIEKVKQGELLIIDKFPLIDLKLNAAIYSLYTLQLELEYNLLLSNCKKNDIKLYIVSIPTRNNIWNITKEERKRINDSKKWQDYLFNKKQYATLLNQVLDMGVEESNFIESCLNLPSVVIKEELCYQCEQIGKYVNVINGNRITSFTPNHIQNYIYLAGNSFVFGPLVDDEHTISSLLQRQINITSDFFYYAVLNEGIRGMPVNESLKRLNHDSFKKKDIIILFIDFHGFLKKIHENIKETFFHNVKVYHLEDDIFNKLDRNRTPSYFIELPAHPNSFGYQLTANYLMKILQENYDDKWKKEVNIDNTFVYEETIDIYKNNKQLKIYLNELEKIDCNGGVNGAIVMNCNPLTYGHKYLIEYAMKLVTHLYIFVVQEDKSIFSFKERFEMVSSCVKRYSNVTVLPSGQFIISTFTFPEYFTKQTANPNTVIDTSNDVIIFGKYIAPILNIKMRFAGEEQTDFITAQYNQTMSKILPKYGIQFIEIPRYIKDDIGVISATKVRKAIDKNDWEQIKELVPEITYEIIKRHCDAKN